MIEKLKQLFYFPIAHYFRFFAKIRLKRWSPRIIVLTGSSGKTTLLNLVESQLGNNVKYSHHANSSYGIPFDILSLKRKTLQLSEWPWIFLKTPFNAFKKPFKENIYIVEADCDRPNEGKFLAEFLKPEITVWLSSSRTHSMNFDSFEKPEERIATEFGYFLENTTKLVIINTDNDLIKKQTVRSRAKTEYLSFDDLVDYSVSEKGTEFKTKTIIFPLKVLLPKEAFISIKATQKLTEYLKFTFDRSFKNFKLAPGRSSFFKGIKDTKLIDSSYNSNLESLSSIVNMFDKFPAKVKWAVVGDLLEQGNVEKEEHEKIANLLSVRDFEKIILMGPRVSKYTYPKLKMNENNLIRFENPREVLDYLEANIQGGEAIMFKGARFLDGVIERLLLNKDDAKFLCRREKVWQTRRAQWGL